MTTLTPWALESLTQKIENWNESAAMQFHTTAQKGHPEKADAVWENSNFGEYTGFHHWGQSFASYYRDDGVEYLLTSNPSMLESFENDLKANILLNKVGKNTGKFNTCRPMSTSMTPYKKVSIQNTPYIYHSIKYFGDQLGTPVVLTAASEADVISIINDIEILLVHIAEIVNGNNGIAGYPSIKFPWLLVNDAGRSWRYLYYWNRSKETLYYQQVGELQKFIQHLRKNNVVISDSVEQLGKDKWAKALKI